MRIRDSIPLTQISAWLNSYTVFIFQNAGGLLIIWEQHLRFFFVDFIAISNPPERILQQFLRLLLLCENVTHFCLNTAHFRAKVNLQVVIDKLNVLAGDKAPALLLNFCNTNATIQLRYLIVHAVCTLGLPSMVDICCSLNLHIVQGHFLFTLILHWVLRPSTQVHKEDLSLTVTQISAVITATFFVLIQNPKGNADIGGNETVSTTASAPVFRIMVYFSP